MDIQQKLSLHITISKARKHNTFQTVFSMNTGMWHLGYRPIVISRERPIQPTEPNIDDQLSILRTYR